MASSLLISQTIAIMEERLRYLFQRYLDSSCTRQEMEEFFGYVKEAQHDDLLRQYIQKIDAELKNNPSYSTHVDHKGRLVISESREMNVDTGRKRKVIPWNIFTGVAASLILIVCAVWFFRYEKSVAEPTSITESRTKKSTDRSESKFLLLEDGTQVWLNAASSLEYPDKFSSGKHEVYLTGEAFFDVKHAEKIPFIIYTGKVSTTVLGTAFNIKAYPGQKNITITVSRGKVKIDRKDGWTTTLTKGQQVKIEPEGIAVQEKKITADEVAGWHQGNLVFDDESLQDILSDLERVYNVRIEVADPTHLSVKYSTSFKKEIGVEQALQVLSKLTDTELKIEKGVYLLQ